MSLVNKRGAGRIGARDNDRRNVGNIGRQSRGDEIGNGRAGRDEHFASHVPAFLFAGELVFKMHSGRARLDHCFGQFENVKRPAEPGFSIGHDRREPVDFALAFSVLNLVGPLQCLVDPFNHCRHAVRRIQALVRIHLTSEIGIRGNLPTAQIDCLQSRLHLLNRLIAGERAEGGHVILGCNSSHSFSAPRRARVCSGTRCLAVAARLLPNKVARPRPSAALPAPFQFDRFA